MKLIIQIPCYNEEDTLAETLNDLPREVEGFSSVEWLVVDDGSTDNTAAIARQHGVDYIISLSPNRGLARAFSAGVEACLVRGADVIVNTDADNQYRADDIKVLVKPIVDKQADVVVGARPIADIEHFSRLKKLLQKVGSWAVRLASGTEVQDAASGFRAFSREAALHLHVHSEYTYTMDTTVQAGHTGMIVMSVPVRINPQTRESRLVKSLGSYIRRTGLAILRMFLIYKPARAFFFLGAVPFLAGVALCVRWLILYFADIAAQEAVRGREPSLILAAILIIAAVQMWLFGVLAELVGANRRLLEDVQYRVKRLALEKTDAEAQRRQLSVVKSAGTARGGSAMR
jgi:glycosyltransferase involved in cell wall biosynthesis